jgi:[ribosomal protein S5]-alanine N-acetyltransferase
MLIPCGEFQIRSYHEDDCEAIVRYANNRGVSINLRDGFPYPYTTADAEGWLKIALSTKPETHFAIATSKELIGGIGLMLQSDVSHRSAEMGYWLGEAYWGKGIATAAVKAFTPWSFEQFHLLRVYATIFDSNPASVRVLEKAGFTFEGRLRKHVVKEGRVMDMLMYAVVKDI